MKKLVIILMIIFTTSILYAQLPEDFEGRSSIKQKLMNGEIIYVTEIEARDKNTGTWHVISRLLRASGKTKTERIQELNDAKAEIDALITDVNNLKETP